MQWSGAHLYWHLRKFPLIRWQLSLLFKMGCRSLQAAWKFDRAENIRNLLDWPLEMLKVLLDKIFTRRRGEIKKDKRWDNFKSDLGVTLQGNRGRLPAHLELLARVSSLHHHALKHKISSRPTMHWVGDWWSWWWCWSCRQPAGRAPPPGPPAPPAGWRGLRATSHHVEITLEQDNCREGQKIRRICHFFPLCPPTCCCGGSWGAVLCRVQRRRVQP